MNGAVFMTANKANVRQETKRAWSREAGACVRGIVWRSRSQFESPFQPNLFPLTRKTPSMETCLFPSTAPSSDHSRSRITLSLFDWPETASFRVQHRVSHHHGVVSIAWKCEWAVKRGFDKSTV